MQKFQDTLLLAPVGGAALAAAASGSVTVTLNGGGTPTLYSDNGVTPMASNVVTTDSSGEYFFYAANGLYDLAFSCPGYLPETRTAVQLYDPANALAAFKFVTTATETGLAASRTLAVVSPLYSTDGGAQGNYTVGLAAGTLTHGIIIACSDETTALTAGVNKVTFRMPYAFTLSGVRCSLTTAQTSGSIFTVDINETGTTILSTKLTIDNTEKTSTTAAIPPVISDTALADDAEITIDIDQIGDSTAKGLKVALIGTKV